jgi:hypothetical protein
MRTMKTMKQCETSPAPRREYDDEWRQITRSTSSRWPSRFPVTWNLLYRSAL